MEDEGAGSGQVVSPQEPPRCGSLEATIDDKGRLRIPTQYVKYINSLGDTKVFITCVNRETARVYPMSVWKVNEAQFRNATPSREDAALMQAFEKLAQYTGDYSDIDGNGRVSLPQKLREVMGMTPKSAAHMTFFKGAFDLETDAVVQRKLNASLDLLMDGLPALHASGIR
jgi:DNA-binding transcriptional regulator/RsmH inhibitor MraZ